MSPQSGAQAAPQAGATLSLEDAIQRAQANEPTFALASATSRIAQLERANARAALLPSLVYHNQFLYTQGVVIDNLPTPHPQTPSLPRFIANNAVHEYISQGVVTETLGFTQYSAVRQADADAARTAAELQVARRGLISTVVTLYYSALSSSEKLAATQRAADEADQFLTLTQQRAR